MAPIYRESNGGYLGAYITPKSDWAVRGNLSNPSAAIDKNLDTAALGSYTRKGSELIIDLHKVCLFETVIIEHGAAANGHCRSVEVSTSVDGKTYNNKYSTCGTRRATIVSLPEPVLARYISIKAEKPGSGRWTIAEIYVQ